MFGFDHRVKTDEQCFLTWDAVNSCGVSQWFEKGTHDTYMSASWRQFVIRYKLVQLCKFFELSPCLLSTATDKSALRLNFNHHFSLLRSLTAEAPVKHWWKGLSWNVIFSSGAWAFVCNFGHHNSKCPPFLLLPPAFYCWAQCHMIWNIPLVSWNRLSHLFLPLSGLLYTLSILAVGTAWEAEKALVLCKHCSAISKASVCCQHLFSSQSKA